LPKVYLQEEQGQCQDRIGNKGARLRRMGLGSLVRKEEPKRRKEFNVD